MSYLYKTPPLEEPVTLAEAKAHLRVVSDDDDALIQNCIRTARWNLERRFRRAFLTQSLVLGLDYFGMPDRLRDVMWPISWWPPAGYQFPINSIIDLRPPVQSVTSVKYTDPSNVVQTVNSTDYVLDSDTEPARLYPALGKVWPTTAMLPNAVRIEFIAGYTDRKLIPDDQKEALKLFIGDLYENREQTQIGRGLQVVQLPFGVEDLMATYRTFLVR